MYTVFIIRMSQQQEELLQCFNRGCGKKFSPETNNDNACCHHPGAPIFHDAYKGWSCCNKKSTDFTEFLNIKGCTVSKHSSVKPAQQETRKHLFPEVWNSKIPAQEIVLSRPPFDTLPVVVQPHVAFSFIEQPIEEEQISETIEIPEGTMCRHGGCNVTYRTSPNSTCVYHPGVPIFHEGMKFWSCCQKRTSDFNAFLSQPGCEEGQHIWINHETDGSSVKCRWDYHQTGSHVVVSIYAKGYCVNTSVIKINPIRLSVKLFFQKKCAPHFEMDVELFGIVDVNNSEATMYSSKIEVKLKKARPCYWPTLEMKPVDKSMLMSSTALDISTQGSTTEDLKADIDVSSL